MTKPDIDPGDLALLWQILRKYLPEDTSFYVFGSRATGKARRFSDLDLAVDHELPSSVLGMLTLELEESLLPWRVDVVPLAELPPQFLDSVVPLPRSTFSH